MTLAACMSGDKPVKGYRQRVAAIQAELTLLQAGGMRRALSAPSAPATPTLVQRMAAATPVGPRVVYRRAK